MSRLQEIVEVLEGMVDATERLDLAGLLNTNNALGEYHREMYPVWDWDGNGPIHSVTSSVFGICCGHFGYQSNPQDFAKYEGSLEKAKAVVDSLRLGSDRLTEMVQLFGRMYIATAAGDREEFESFHVEYNAVGDEMFGRNSWADHVVGYIFDQARNDLINYPMYAVMGDVFEGTAAGCLKRASDRMELIYPCL